MSDVTRILSQIEPGDPPAAEQLLPLVYEELRKLAAAKMAQEKPDRRCRRRRWCMRRTSGWWMHDKAKHWDSRGDISLRQPPRRCGGFWWSRRAAESRLRSAAAGWRRVRCRIECLPMDATPPDDLLGPERGSGAAGQPRSREGQRWSNCGSLPDSPMQQAAEALGISLRNCRTGTGLTPRRWLYCEIWPSPSEA